MHMAPGSAYNLLKKVYTILTGKEVQDTVQDFGEQEPYYAKPTIAKKVKDLIDIVLRNSIFIY